MMDSHDFLGNPDVSQSLHSACIRFLKEAMNGHSLDVVSIDSPVSDLSLLPHI